MRNSLDPQNPAFAYMGPKESVHTMVFVDAKGRLCWVPYEALKSFFKRELPRQDFAAWHKRLVLKDIK